ncbi:MAG: HAMP domain-containing histidine kinase, partial [Anaerolineales bacterium]
TDEIGTLARSYNQMADRVQEIIVTLQRFASDAAHEIHTPLTALRTNLELARRDVLEGNDENLVEAQAQVERLEALTAGLLDLSRIESGSQEQSRAAVDLVRLAEEVGELYASRAEQAGVEFDLSLPSTPVTVQGDVGQLRSALSNLLGNAVKFTPQGGSIRFGVRQEGAMAVSWVEDTGIGIPDEDLPHLFQRFHRGRNAASYPGSGLGLAIVRAIVEQHGGQIQAESHDQGSSFTLRIPIAPPST